jgi:hypothetical protein
LLVDSGIGRLDEERKELRNEIRDGFDRAEQRLDRLTWTLLAAAFMTGDVDERCRCGGRPAARAEPRGDRLEGPARDLAGFALLSGMILLVASLGQVVLGAPFRPRAVSDLSAREIANYTTERFTHEPHLWRIHLRTIRGMVDSIEVTTKMVDRTVAALRRAGLFFLAGLSAVAESLEQI